MEQIDVDTVLDMGSYCDNLITDPHFQFLSAHYEKRCIDDLLATKSHEAKAREALYSKITAHREFIETLVEWIKMKNEAVKKQNPDHTDIIDDPSVHDIYG